MEDVDAWATARIYKLRDTAAVNGMIVAMENDTAVASENAINEETSSCLFCSPILNLLKKCR